MPSNPFITPGLILDIDDTLCDTSLTCAQAVISHLNTAAAQTLALKFLKVYGMPDLVPEWQSPPIRSLIMRLLTDKVFLAHLPPILEAQRHIALLNQTFPIACYLTSRLSDFQTVTFKWLTQHGFPAAPLICRPEKSLAKDWKLRFIVDHKIMATAYIDNEIYVPGNLDFGGKLLEIIRFTKLTPAHSKLTICDDWETVIKQLL